MATLDQLHPIPKSVTISGTTYNLVAFYYPDPVHLHATDVAYNAGCLGNFFPCAITLDVPNPATHAAIVPTPTFHNSEAAFQALKWWTDDKLRAMFESLKTGPEVFNKSKNLKGADLTYAGLDRSSNPSPLAAHRSGFDAGRLNAMWTVLTQKYTPANSDIQAALLATGDAYLLEHAEGSHDTFWSDGGYDHSGTSVTGANYLGRTLMALRASLGGSPAPLGTDNDTMVMQFKQVA